MAITVVTPVETDTNIANARHVGVEEDVTP
jgi:hypothetical protein